MISIHAPREGGDATPHTWTTNRFKISIHAPREGGDHAQTGVRFFFWISIHAPREGGDVLVR